MRRVGVTAATFLLAMAAGGCAGSGERVAHSCDATDKRFLQTAGINVTALGIWTADYGSGEMAGEEVAQEAFDAARRVSRVKPSDPSLRKAQKYLDAMFNEYGEAVALHSQGSDAGARMYRAYGLANFARDVLVDAQPELMRRGCDVGPLL